MTKVVPFLTATEPRPGLTRRIHCRATWFIVPPPYQPSRQSIDRFSKIR